MSTRQLTAYLLVAGGGAVGSVLRYHAMVLFGAHPFTTFGVNITGSFLLGLLAAVTNNSQARVFLGTGVLGGYTTFSAWQMEALAASQVRPFYAMSLTILLGSMVSGFASCWLGYALGHRLWR